MYTPLGAFLNGDFQAGNQFAKVVYLAGIVAKVGEIDAQAGSAIHCPRSSTVVDVQYLLNRRVANDARVEVSRRTSRSGIVISTQFDPQRDTNAVQTPGKGFWNA
jgi:hypothetical protein